jgi:hypothetical protein
MKCAYALILISFGAIAAHGGGSSFGMGFAGGLFGGMVGSAITQPRYREVTVVEQKPSYYQDERERELWLREQRLKERERMLQARSKKRQSVIVEEDDDALDFFIDDIDDEVDLS